MQKFGSILAGCIFIYLAVANVVFVIRHPWATEIQRIMCIKEIILF